MYLAEIGKIMFQYKSGLLPDAYNNTFLRRNQVHDYDTRNASSFHVPRCRIKVRRFSFQYQGPSYFNSLSPDVVSSVSVSTFKKRRNYSLVNCSFPSTLFSFYYYYSAFASKINLIFSSSAVI